MQHFFMDHWNESPLKCSTTLPSKVALCLSASRNHLSTRPRSQKTLAFLSYIIVIVSHVRVFSICYKITVTLSLNIHQSLKGERLFVNEALVNWFQITLEFSRKSKNSERKVCMISKKKWYSCEAIFLSYLKGSANINLKKLSFYSNHYLLKVLLFFFKIKTPTIRTLYTFSKSLKSHWLQEKKICLEIKFPAL